jgi:hypothetical protein
MPRGEVHRHERPHHDAHVQVSSVAPLKSLGVKDLDAHEERTVNIGHEEVKIDRL